MKQRTILSLLPLVFAASPAFAQAPAAPAAGAPAPAPAAPPPAVAAPMPPPPPAPLAEAAPAAEPAAEPAKEEKKDDAPPDKVTVAKTGFFQPSANLQVWWAASHIENPATPDESWTNTLRIRRAELKIKGEIIPKTFAYMVMIDPARLLDFQKTTVPVTGEGATGSVSVLQPPGTGGNSSILQDVQLTYLSDYADVSIGQFKIPVSLEGSGSASKLYFPERALVSRKYGDRRDIGLKLEKKFDMFGYNLGLFNGQGQNNLDTNDQKDLALRLEVYPIKELTAAVVGYMGVTERNLAGTKDRVEGDLKLDMNNILLQAEYIRGWDMPANDGTRIEGQGFYVVAGYTFFEKLQPIFRVGSLDPNVDVDEPGANDEYRTYELGVNYYFKSNDCKLQLAGGFFDAEQRTAPTRFDLTLAAQIAF